MLIRNELCEFENGNCLFDGIGILHVSSRLKNLIYSIGDAKNLNEIIALDHEYVTSLLDLTAYVDNITQYIAGFISYKLQRIVNCYVCKNQLIGTEMPLLSKLKNEGPYLILSKDVCRISEQIIREYSNQFNKINIKRFLVHTIFHRIGNGPFSNQIMDDYVCLQDTLDNHQTQLCKYIIELYVNTRLFHEANKM